MFSHVMIGTNDIDRAKTFYDAVLAVLGAPAGARNVARSGHVRVFYRHEQVQAFHDAALAHGGVSIEDPPGPREGPAGKLHLAYVRDLDGHKLCALHRVPAAA